MPRDPKDISVVAPERQQRRIGELEDQKDPLRIRVGAGPAGPEGAEGKPGLNGAKWYSGTEEPAGGLGSNGDFYLRTSTEDVYEKAGGAWNIITNIKGEKGEIGSTGASGKEGPAGSLENTDWKNSVRAATTANITIATALNPGDVLDGVTLAENDRVLVKNQTTTKENGIWIVKASPSRATDADAVAELSGGSTIYVEEGTRNKRRTFQIITAGNITPGTTSHEYQQLGFRDFGIVEALPSSEAVKNDRCTYIANKSSGNFWELSYDGEGEYPWKKIGGPPLFAEVTANESRENTAYGALSTAGPSITLPLKGDYDIKVGAKVAAVGGEQTQAHMSYDIGATGAVDADSYSLAGNVYAANTTDGPSGSRLRRKTGLTAVTLTAKYRTTKKGAFWENRWISADPIRVG